MPSDDLIRVRIKDACRICTVKNIPKFIGFLSETDLGNAVNIVNKENLRCCSFGGFSNASRKFLCIMPEWLNEEDVEFPISMLEFDFRKGNQLSHRDFLGAVMALGVKKETVGDIIVNDGKAFMFVTENMSEYIKTQISKVGSEGVAVDISDNNQFDYTPKMQNCVATVASMRLDCVVSAICNCSRKAAVELIESGLVVVNSTLVEKPTFLVKNDSVLSVRKHGKFVIIDCTSITKKQRVVLEYKKYL